MRLAAAWTACDMQAAMALSLSYDEVTALTSKPIDRADWEKEAHDFADQRCHELSQSKGHILTAMVVKTEHQRPSRGSNLKKDIEVVIVQFVIEQDGQAKRGTRLVFVRMPDGLKFISRP